MSHGPRRVQHDWKQTTSAPCQRQGQKAKVPEKYKNSSDKVQVLLQSLDDWSDLQGLITGVG